MKHSIELDFGSMMTFGDLSDHLRPYNLKASLVELEGPGGGNPVLELHGTYKEIVMYLAYYTEGADEDMQYHVTRIDQKED